MRPVLNRACHWNTYARLKVWSPEACCIIVRVCVTRFPKLAQNMIHTRCSFLWSMVKIATGHVHDFNQTRLDAAHIHPATCNLAHWISRHGSPTIYRRFMLPQLLYSWRHQSQKFWIPHRNYNQSNDLSSEHGFVPGAKPFIYKKVINHSKQIFLAYSKATLKEIFLFWF